VIEREYEQIGQSYFDILCNSPRSITRVADTAGFGVML
jgi:hypothetical protein